MRKVLPAVVIGLGAFLLTMGLLLKFVAYPRLAVVPLDMNTQAVVVDDDASFFDADNVKPATGKLTTISTVIGDPQASEDASEQTGRKVAVWELGQKSDNNDDNYPMSASTERVAFDRTTGEAINCCEENVDGTQVTHEGLVVKFPFDTQPVDTYRWWDGNTKAAYPVKYEGEDEVQGMGVYKFTTDVPLTKYATRELPDYALGLKDAGPIQADRYYSNKRTFYVQPATGVIIDRVEEQHQEFRAPGAETLDALDTTSRFTQETVDANVEEYKSKGALLAAVNGPASYAMIVLGVLLLLAGVLLSLVLGRRRREDAAHAQPAYAGTPAYYDSPAHGDTPAPVDPDQDTVRRSDLRRDG